MSDLRLAAFWLLCLGAGLAFVVALRERGLAATYARDLLHVSAGVWVLGWPFWRGAAAPIVIVALALLLVLAAPRPLVRAISGGDESWRGVVGYVAAFAVLTILGLLSSPLPAAIALLSLSLGDGLGGFVGRRFGRLHYRAPWAKAKTLEGSLVVALGAFLAVLLVALVFAAPIALPTAVLIALIAATVEALAPRASDNLLVPAAVWLGATLMGVPS